MRASSSVRSIANNHGVDFTYQGLVDTMDFLKERDLVYAGAGMTLGEARSPAYLDSANGRVGLVACASTFGRSAQAAASRPDIGGRPGLSPMRYETEYVLDSRRLAALQDIDKVLGTDAITRRRREMRPDPKPEAFRFLDKTFVEGDTPRVSTSPKESDLEDIAHWISEARRRSDLVVVSIHAHEGQNGDLNTQDIADFIIPMAHHWIDAGADVFLGHGPHTLRGLEIYKGKPIFYSRWATSSSPMLLCKGKAARYTSNSIIPSTATPADITDASRREDGSYKGMNGDPQFWRSIIPVCRFEGTTLVDIELHPVDLGFDLSTAQRGIPVLAGNEQGLLILKNLENLSAPFGTKLRIESDGERMTGRVLLS